MNNDYLDAEDDLRSDARDQRKTAFLIEHMDAALALQWALVGLLVVAALLFDASLLVALVFGGGTCVLYSARLKGVPIADVVAMAVWGLSMPLCGFPLSSGLGLCLALQLGAFAAVYETIQVLRDARHDATAGIRTTAVVLGPARTRRLSRACMGLAAAFAAFVLQPVAGAIAAGALLVPLGGDDVERRWTIVKAVYAAAWLVICAQVFWASRSAGLLWSIAASPVGP
jgi:4-hydroxybenzoate polyprenyltransferase